MQCPQCSEEVEVMVPAHASHAPLICRECRRGWFPSEIANASKWDPGLRAYKDNTMKDIRRVISEDQASLEEHLGTPDNRPNVAAIRSWAQGRARKK